MFLYLSVEGRIVSVCNHKLSKGWEGAIVCACKDGGGTEKERNQLWQTMNTAEGNMGIHSTFLCA